MIPVIDEATHVSGDVIHIRFHDGLEAGLDLASELWGEVFEPLKEVEVFRCFRLDRELNTIVWPTDADFAPELLYEKARCSR